MRILILNWRSINDPLAGGAELATIEYAKRWVKTHNAQVTWLSAPPNKKTKSEDLDGIKFKYIGSPLKRDNTLQMLVYFPLFYLSIILEYFKNYKGKVDIIIDQSHGFPFLTPLYAKEKIILYIHEHADVIWDKMFNFPINIIGKFLENIILKFYKNILTITGSNSTKKDLVTNVGLSPNKIKIVSYAINLKPLSKPKTKYQDFTILFLNRIVKMKRPEVALKIFAKIKEQVPNSRLIIIGRGEEVYLKKLKDIINTLNIKEFVEIKGYIESTEKISILQKVNVLINTSYKEGWGLVNIEANSQGTPVVAFDVPGCRESVKDGVSGFLAQDEADFVSKILKLKDVNLEQSAIEFSKQFNYDEKAEEFWNLINEK